MLARAGIVAVAMTTALVGAPCASADDDGQALCNFTLTGPSVVDVHGVAMVTAGLDPAGCTGTAQPTFAQVCLSAPGSAGRCTELSGYSNPRVFVSPYAPGTTYTVSGRGCAGVGNPPQPICTTVGPHSAAP